MGRRRPQRRASPPGSKRNDVTTGKPEPEPKKNKTSILIVDDHPILRHGLAMLINQEPDLTVCGEAEEAYKAVEAIAALKPELIIVDISLQTIDGIELIKRIKAKDESLSILVLSMHDEALYAERALRAGARGYIMKQEANQQVVAAIRQVLSGEIYVSDKMKTKLLRKMVDPRPAVGGTLIEGLSDRELEVFRLIGRGYRTRQIAEMLHVSVKTVDSYRENIKQKLKLRDATELLQQAIQWGRSEPSD
ncbi:MAG: response regulator [Acidobacteriota bacterium]